MLHAIFQTGGKQYRVTEGEVLYIERLTAPVTKTITFDEVLALVDDDGDSRFGAPLLEGASVTATVVKHGKAKKIKVFKMKPKKNYRRMYGHRQPYTQVQIQSILKSAGKENDK